MALADENGGGISATMPVAPLNYGGYPMMANGLGNFGLGGDWSWILLLLLISNGGWGGLGGWGMGGMMGAGMLGMDMGFGLYPWLNNSQNINDGFRGQAINTQVSSIADRVTSGFGDVQLGIAGVNQNISSAASGIQNSLCSGFASVNQEVSNGFAQAEIANNSRQIANMQQAFNNQLSTVQGFNGVQNSVTDCCCKTQSGIDNLRYTVATEACADRAAVNDALQAVTAQSAANTNALMNTINGGIQSIKDQLCQQQIDNLKTANSNLQTQVLMRDLAASQNAQTAALTADNAAQTQYIVNRVAPYPIPSYSVGNPYTSVNSCGYNGPSI